MDQDLGLPDSSLLDEEDRGLLDAVAAPTLPVTGATPVPDLPETEIVEPPAPYVGEGPAAPVDLDAIAAAPAPAPALAPGAIPGATKMPKDAAIDPASVEKQRDLDKQTAEVNAATADRTAAVAQQADDDERLAYADYLERRKAGEDALATATKAAQKAELVDPRAKTPGWRSALAVIFGGLGAGLSAAGGGDATNRGLQTLTKKWDDDLELQKANIGRLKDNVVMARTGLRDIDDARQAMRIDANARTLGRYNLAIKQGEAQLRKLGVPTAEIAADQRLAALRAARANVEANARKDADAHALNAARINHLNAQAARNNAKARATGKGGGGGGGALSEFVAAAGALAPGDPIPPAVAEMGRRAGLKTNQIAAEVDRYRNSGDKGAADIRTRTVTSEGREMVAPTTKSAEDFRTFESSAHQVEKALNDLEKNYQEYGFELSALSPIDALKSKGVREREGIMERIVLPAKEVGKLGALSGPDAGILERITGGKVSQLLGDEVGIKNMREWLARARSGSQLSLGMAPGTASPAKSSAAPRAVAPSKQQDSEAVQWAKANKTDPRAREILRVNGVR